MEYNIILASQSPRRKELLAQAGFNYTVEPSTIEEVITKTVPWEVVMELSEQKAMDVYQKHEKYEKESAIKDMYDASENSILVIGADTIVAYGERILGKPHSAEAAMEMLTLLQGNTHQVYTGVSLVWNGQKHTFYEKTEVEFYPMAEAEIVNYVQSGDCMDKAGAYGIQTHFGVYVKQIHGDYNNVVGLPIARLYQEMKKQNLL